MPGGHALQVRLLLISFVINHRIHAAGAAGALRDDDRAGHALADDPQPGSHPGLPAGDRLVLARLADHQRAVDHVDAGGQEQRPPEVLRAVNRLLERGRLVRAGAAGPAAVGGL
eukprot:SAG22_NODE_3498_length_1680_cov_1.380139_1_plen_113_part_10